ncbi:MAG: flotillin family protein [Spirochaetia bacterium]
MFTIFLAAVSLAGLVVLTLLFLATLYKRCPSDRILVVFGRVGTGKSARCMHGGGSIVWPLIQDYAYLNLTPMTINIPLQGALSIQNIRVNVPSTFTIGVSTEPSIMLNAAERLLGLKQGSIEEMAREIIFGQLRLTVASLTIEQINQDRESFLEAIRRNVDPELNKIGLSLLNVNITDITDESNYIESIGKKAASEAINRAKVDVAEQEKLGAIGQAQATKEKEVNVAQNLADGEKGKKRADAERRVYVADQESQAVTGENTAQATIAERNAELAVKQAEAMRAAEVAKRKAEAEIQKAQYAMELERQRAEQIANMEVEKQRIEIEAAAKASQARIVAQGEADATILRYQAEAEGLRKLLDSKAAGYQELVKGAGGHSHDAANLLLIEKLENIVELQTEAIKNIKIDKITVWDGGNQKDGGSSTSNFMSNLIHSLPPLHDIASMAGVNLPEFLGSAKKPVSVAAKPDEVKEKSVDKGKK